MEEKELQINCPACGRGLSKKVIDDLIVDVCDGGCGGIWFDNGELEDVDDCDEAIGDALVDIAVSGVAVMDQDGKRACPCCDGVIMQKRHYGPRQPVMIDECPGCGGIWLDAGELKAIRETFESSEQREMVDSAISDIIASRVSLATAEEAAKTRAFHAVAKFLGHLWHDYDLSHFRGRDWPPWRGSFPEKRK